MTTESREVALVAVDQIDVLNSRERNSKVFAEVVSSIAKVGLKKPITVARRQIDGGKVRYLLVCGEGRLNAFKLLEQTHIPAQIIAANDEDAFIMGLVENAARRHAKPLELLSCIQRLAEQGYDRKAICLKTGLRGEYVQGILLLLSQGEAKLLAAVQRGVMPLTTATIIVQAGDDDAKMQEALQEACESGGMKGKHLLDARKLIEKRSSLRRSRQGGLEKPKALTATKLVRVYQEEVARQKEVIRKSDNAQRRLLFILGAMRQLLTDDNFVNLLRAEGLVSLPAYLSERVHAGSLR